MLKRTRKEGFGLTVVFSTLSIFIVVVAPGVGQTEPIAITTCQELQDMQGNLAGDYYLANDIDCSDTVDWNGGQGFDPIGTIDTPFTGTLDGKGYTISSLSINRSAEDAVGLFGFIDDGCEIKNVHVEDVDNTGDMGTGGLVGWTALHADVSISYCSVTGSVAGGYGVGGLLGYNRGGTINRCSSTATVTGDGDLYDFVGGLIGINNYGSVSHSWSTGDVNATGAYSGGFTATNTGQISECYATGTVNGQLGTGGFVGKNDSTTVNGFWEGTITDCYARGSVNGTERVGGFAGANTSTDDTTTTISRCYSTGAVTGSSDVGGFVGYIYKNSVISSCFWDTETSGQAASAGGTGKTTAEMKQQATYGGWDFQTIWGIDEAIDYPYLLLLDYIILHKDGAFWSSDTDWEMDTPPYYPDSDYAVDLQFTTTDDTMVILHRDGALWYADNGWMLDTPPYYPGSDYARALEIWWWLAAEFYAILHKDGAIYHSWDGWNIDIPPYYPGTDYARDLEFRLSNYGGPLHLASYILHRDGALWNSDTGWNLATPPYYAGTGYAVDLECTTAKCIILHQDGAVWFSDSGWIMDSPPYYPGTGYAVDLKLKADGTNYYILHQDGAFYDSVSGWIMDSPPYYPGSNYARDLEVR